MIKKIVKWTGIVLAVILGLLIALAAYVVISRMIAIDTASEKIGPAPGWLEDGGRKFRDLNKNGRLDPYEDRRVPVEGRVENLLRQMTLEEKAGLFFHTSIAPGSDGEIAGPTTLMNMLPVEVALFDKNMSFFNLFILDDAQNTARWTNRVQHLAARTRLGIPVTISSDPRHSAAASVASFSMEGFSQWPEQLGFAALRDPELMERFGRIAAREYRAVGIHSALHPMADLATEPRWARINGTFGEDAELAATLTAAYVRGFQGSSLGRQSVSTVTKHFAGGGPQKDGWDAHFRFGKDQVYPGDNLEYHLIPFRAAIDAGTAQIMPYYGVPVGQTGEDVGFAFNREMITGLLREKMDFDGIVLSDWNLLTPAKILGIDLGTMLPVAGVKNYGVETLSPEDRALKAINAGVDQFGGDDNPQYVVDLVRKGKLSEARVDESARRLLALKFRLGLFDNPFVNVEKVKERTNLPADVKLGEQVQRRSQVLLTNKPAAGNSGKPILPLTQGVRIYVENLDPKIAAGYGTVVDDAGDADVAIINMDPPYDHDGPNAGIVHQGRLYFTPRELEPVIDLARRKPTVVTFMLERPFVVPELAATSKAMLVNFGANDAAILDVLFGRASPEGKLPFDMPSTWKSVLRQKPDVPFDSEKPLFRYGHGLRYGE